MRHRIETIGIEREADCVKIAEALLKNMGETLF
jgi:hypothetical protein